MAQFATWTIPFISMVFNNVGMSKFLFALLNMQSAANYNLINVNRTSEADQMFSGMYEGMFQGVESPNL